MTRDVLKLEDYGLGQMYKALIITLILLLGCSANDILISPKEPEKNGEEIVVIETRYNRSDQHTVNGLTAYKLGITESAANFYDFQVGGDFPVTWRSDVYIRHVDESETTLGLDVASTVRSSGGHGLQNGTWNCPATDLVPTDAIKVIEKMIITDLGTFSHTFITEQLGMYKLKAVTWTFKRLTSAAKEPMQSTYYFDNSGYPSRIEGITLFPYKDIGIRVVQLLGAAWNFATIWQSNASALPTLKGFM